MKKSLFDNITAKDVFATEVQRPQMFTDTEINNFKADFDAARREAERNFLSLDALLATVVAYGKVYQREVYPVSVNTGIKGKIYNHLEDTDYDANDELYETQAFLTGHVKGVHESWPVEIAQICKKYTHVDGSELTEADIRNATNGLVIMAKPGVYDVAFRTPFDLYVLTNAGYKLLAVRGSYVNVGVDVSETENGKVATLIPDWGVWCVSDKVFGFMRHEVSDVKITL